jgi:hypothetical protein
VDMRTAHHQYDQLQRRGNEVVLQRFDDVEELAEFVGAAGGERRGRVRWAESAGVEESLHRWNAGAHLMNRHQRAGDRLQLVAIAVPGHQLKCQPRCQVGDARGDAVRTRPQCVGEVSLVALTHLEARPSRRDEVCQERRIA